MHKGTIHPVYAAWWVSLLFLLVMSEFITYPSWALPTIVIAFVVGEGIALARKQKGDTASEMMWSFTAGKHDRRWIAWSVAIYLPLKFIMLAIDVIPTWIPSAILALGVIMWLMPHFSKQGKDG